MITLDLIKNYLKIIIYIIKKNFVSFLSNLYLIIIDIKKSILFIIVLPFIFSIILVQVYIGGIFFLYYFFIFIIYNNILKTEYVISCKEVPLNSTRLLCYAIFNTFFLIPKTKAFIIIYNFFSLIYNKKNLINYSILFCTIISLFIIYLIKFFIFFFIGFSYLSLYLTSILIINFFDTLSLKYENSKAKYQHIIINCLLNNAESIGYADELKIIINQHGVVFNTKHMRILNNVSESKIPFNDFRLFKEAVFYSNLNNCKKYYLNNHYCFCFQSLTDPNVFICVNPTSGEKYKVFNKNGSYYYEISEDGYKPNLLGQNKFNYFVNPYIINKKEIILGPLNPETIMKIQFIVKSAYYFILFNHDNQVLKLENGLLINEKDGVTVSKFCNEKDIIIKNEMNFISEFEFKNFKRFEDENIKKLHNYFKDNLKGINLNSEKIKDYESLYKDFPDLFL